MKKKILFGSLLFLCLCAGCSGEKVEKQSGEQKAVQSDRQAQLWEYEFPKEYVKQTGNTSFETEIIVDNQSGKNIFFQGSATLQKINPEILKEEIFKEISQAAEEHTINSTNYIGEEEELKIWQTPSGETLYYSSVNTSYTSPLFMHINQAFTLPETAAEDAGYSTTEEFEGFTRDHAYQNLAEILEKSGIHLPKEYICYTLPAALMAEREYVEDIEGNEDASGKKKDWDSGDDTYYFVFQSRYCGLPSYHPFAYQITKDSLENAPLQAAVARDGLAYLSIERVFDYKQEEKTLRLKTFDEIAEALETQFSNVLGTANYKVKRAELKAMEKMTGKDSYTMTPVWVIHIETEDEDGVRQFQKILDGETAREIIFS